MEITPVYFAAGGVAQRLNIPEWKVSKAVDEGKLRPAVRLLGARRDTFGFTPDEIDRYRREHLEKAS